MPKYQIIIYQIENGKTAIDLKIEDDTVSLTLNQISDLFYNTNRRFPGGGNYHTLWVVAPRSFNHND